MFHLKARGKEERGDAQPYNVLNLNLSRFISKYATYYTLYMYLTNH